LLGTRALAVLQTKEETLREIEQSLREGDGLTERFHQFDHRSIVVSHLRLLSAASVLFVTAGQHMPTAPRAAMRIMAVDWSGAKRRPEHRMWLAEAAGDRLVGLARGRNRAALTEHVIAQAQHDPDLIVGLDFAFSFPAWFVREQGCTSAHDVWTVCEERGEDWLRTCAPPFWGRPGRPCPPDAGAQGFRRTEQHAPRVGSIGPKSVFQIGGAGAVGTGSIRGMAMLARFRRAGFSVWPFDTPTLPMLIEIYPRLLTGSGRKSCEGCRRAYLNQRPTILGKDREDAASSEDAFDAAVSALAMATVAEQFKDLKCSSGDDERLEGRIWYPTPPSAVGGEAFPGCSTHALPLPRE
jgi:hypothetical protein